MLENRLMKHQIKSLLAQNQKINKTLRTEYSIDWVKGMTMNNVERNKIILLYSNFYDCPQKNSNNKNNLSNLSIVDVPIFRGRPI